MVHTEVSNVGCQALNVVDREAERDARGAAPSWPSTTTTTGDVEAAEGITAELGVYDDLLECLVPGEPYVEYGIVEHRFSELRPNVYAELLERYGHTRLGPKPYTASAFLGAALGWLRDHDEILIEFAPATGYWSYNGVIAYCALPPGPADGSRRTYASYAEALGLDPDA